MKSAYIFKEEKNYIQHLITNLGVLCFSFTNWKQVNVLGDQNTEWIRGTTSLDWKLAHEGSTLGIKLRLSFCGRPGHPLWSGSPDQLENDLLGLPPLCVNCCVDLEGMKKIPKTQ